MYKQKSNNTISLEKFRNLYERLQKANKTKNVKAIDNIEREINLHFINLCFNFFYEKFYSLLDSYIKKEFEVDQIDGNKITDGFLTALKIYSVNKRSLEEGVDEGHLNEEDIDRVNYLLKEFLKGTLIVKDIPENKEWLEEFEDSLPLDKKGFVEEFWLSDYPIQYEVIEEKVKNATQSRVANHMNQIKNLIEILSIYVNKEYLPVDPDNLNSVEKFLDLIIDKYLGKPNGFDSSIVSDLKIQINAVKSLHRKNIGNVSSRVENVKIYTQNDPMKIFQMGDNVNGSCLSSDSFNSWSCNPNAFEINKKVLWIEDEKGRFLARVLVAIAEISKADGTIVRELIRFPTYYASNSIDLDVFVDEYLLELCDKLGIKPCDDSKIVSIESAPVLTEKESKADYVKNLLFSDWYQDPVQIIKHYD